MAGVTRGDFLVDAGRVRVGDWRSISAVRGEVCGHQSWDSAIEYKSTVGNAVGHSGFRRIAWKEPGDLRAGDWGFASDDPWSCGDRGVFGDRQGAVALERSGIARERAVQRATGLC